MTATIDLEIKLTLNPEQGWKISIFGRNGAMRKPIAEAPISPENALRLANGMDQLCPELKNNDSAVTALTLVTMANAQAIVQLRLQLAEAERDLAMRTRMLESLQLTMRTPVRTI